MSVSVRPLHEDAAAGQAQVIRDEAEAIAAARRLAPSIAADAIERDRERRLPYREIDTLSQAGLWGITIPKEYGGAGVSSAVLAEVTAILSAADASIGQIPQNHFFMVEAIRLTGSEAQRRWMFGRVLAGERIGNALSEVSSRTLNEYETTISPEGSGWTTETALAITNKLFELAGTRSAMAENALDRHWRNARTHTLHDPVRWKFHAIGNYALNGVKPPRHGAL